MTYNPMQKDGRIMKKIFISLINYFIIELYKYLINLLCNYEPFYLFNYLKFKII